MEKRIKKDAVSPTRAGKDGARAGRARQTRAERSNDTLQALFDAAAHIVGEVGYVDASIARITMRAEVAQGTFYNYFNSRQELFDQLLPRLGSRMLHYISTRIDPDLRGPEREIARLRAYFDYLEEHPEFYRILYEAETLAPAAHATHIDLVAEGFVRALRRSRARGEIPEAFDDRDLEPIAYTLLAARGYLSMRYGGGANGGAVPDWVIEAYGKLIRYGLLGDDADAGRQPDDEGDSENG